MKIQTNQHGIYNPRKAGGGCAAVFQNDNKGCFVKFGKQVGSEMHKFDWKAGCAIKLGITDLGVILAFFSDKPVGVESKENKIPKSVSENGELAIFHKNEKAGTTTSIVLKPYEKRGITFGVYRGEGKFGVLLSHGDIEILKVLFADAIMRVTYAEFEVKDKEPADA